jgi:hypothetical protein
MAAFNEQWDLAQNPEFQRRVQQAAVKSAIAVAAEDAETANHAARVAWGNQILRSPESYGKMLAYGVLSNAAISAASLDSDIEFTVNSQWDAYAVTGA